MSDKNSLILFNELIDVEGDGFSTEEHSLVKIKLDLTDRIEETKDMIRALSDKVGELFYYLNNLKVSNFGDTVCYAKGTLLGVTGNVCGDGGLKVIIHKDNSGTNYIEYDLTSDIGNVTFSQGNFFSCQMRFENYCRVEFVYDGFDGNTKYNHACFFDTKGSVGQWDGFEPPENFVATKGTRTDGVNLTWDAYTGAVSFKIYRNGSELTEIMNGSAVSYLDISAPVSDIDDIYSIQVKVGTLYSNSTSSDTGWRRASIVSGINLVKHSDEINKVEQDITLTWAATPRATNYRITKTTVPTDPYVWPAPTGSTTEIFYTTNLTYVDISLTPKTTVTYNIQAQIGSFGYCTTATTNSMYIRTKSPQMIPLSDNVYSPESALNPAYTFYYNRVGIEVVISVVIYKNNNIIFNGTISRNADKFSFYNDPYMNEFEPCKYEFIRGSDFKSDPFYVTKYIDISNVAGINFSATDKTYTDKVTLSWNSVVKSGNTASSYDIKRKWNCGHEETYSFLINRLNLTYDDTSPGAWQYLLCPIFLNAGDHQSYIPYFYGRRGPADQGCANATFKPRHPAGSSVPDSGGIMLGACAGESLNLGNYDIYKYNSGTGSYEILASNLSTTNYLDTSVLPGNTYLYYYKMRVGSNISDPSDIITVVMGIPMPVNVTNTMNPDDSCTINWEHPTWNFSGREYEVYNSLTDTLLTTTTSNSYTISSSATPVYVYAKVRTKYLPTSIYSEYVMASNGSVYRNKFHPPLNSSATNNPSSVTLMWSHNPLNLNMQRYLIKRVTPNTTEEIEILFSLDGYQTSHLDEDAYGDNTEYKIFCCDGARNHMSVPAIVYGHITS